MLLFNSRIKKNNNLCYQKVHFDTSYYVSFTLHKVGKKHNKFESMLSIRIFILNISLETQVIFNGFQKNILLSISLIHGHYKRFYHFAPPFFGLVIRSRLSNFL